MAEQTLQRPHNRTAGAEAPGELLSIDNGRSEKLDVNDSMLDVFPERSMRLTQLPPLDLLYTPRSPREGEEVSSLKKGYRKFIRADCRELEDLVHAPVTTAHDFLKGKQPPLEESERRNVRQTAKRFWTAVERYVWSLGRTALSSVALERGIWDKLQSIPVANRSGHVIFENRLHMLSALYCIETFIDEQSRQLARYLSLDAPPAQVDVVSTPLERIQQRFRRADDKHGVRLVSTSFRDPVTETHAFLYIPSLHAIRDVQGISARAALRSVHEACRLSCGAFSLPALEFIRTLVFTNTSGSVFCTGEELLRRVDPAQLKAVLDGGQIDDSSTGRTPDARNRVTPAPTRKGSLVAGVERDSAPARLSATSSHSLLKYPSLYYLLESDRELLPHERSIHVPELDACRSIKLMSAKEMTERVGVPASPQEATKLVNTAFDELQRAEDIFVSAIASVWQRVNIPLERLSTCPAELQDVRLTGSDGKVIFENFAHLLSACSAAGDYYRDQELKLQRKHGATGQMGRDYVWSPINLLRSVLEHPSFEQEKFIERRIGIFNSTRPTYCNLASLGEVKDPHRLDAVSGLVTLTEACINVCGHISPASVARVDKLLFADLDGGQFAAGSAFRNAIGINDDKELFDPDKVSVVSEAENFPSFRWSKKDNAFELARVSRQLNDGEQVLHLEEVYVLSEELFRRAEDWVQDAPLSTKEERKECFREYSEHCEPIRRVYLEGVAAALRKANIGLGDLSTSPEALRGTVFTAYGNLVIFESFGHMLSVCSQIAKFHTEQKKKLKKLLDINSPVSSSSSRWEIHDILAMAGEAAGIASESAILHHLSKTFTAPNGLVSRGTLHSLTGVDLSEMTRLQAAAALREACLDSYGEVTLQAIRKVEALSYCDREGRIFVGGSALRSAAGIAPEFIAPIGISKQGPRDGAQQSSRKTPQQVRSDVYRELFEDLEVPVGSVFLALCALGEMREGGRSFRSFDEMIVRSRKNAEGGTPSPTSKPGSAIDVFKRLIASHRPRHVDLTVVGRERFADLLNQLCYRLYDGDNDLMRRELETYRTDAATAAAGRELADEILKDIVPSLLARFDKIRDFEVPSGLRITPHDFQLDAIVSALALEKWLLILGPGTGKTETGAVLSEVLITSGECSGILWTTKAGVRADTARRLAEDILPAGRVVNELTPDFFGGSADDFASKLKSTHYLVASYDTVRSLRQKRPEHFSELQHWCLRAGKILDEGHVLDNPNSERCKAIRALPSVKTAILTATPVQHRKERIATLLHLAMPEKYPDPELLAVQFAADKKLARAMLHTHATLYGITDAAKFFAPFSPQQTPEQQLASRIPRIPRVVIERRKFVLSVEHSLRYVDLATNYDAWAKANGRKLGHLQQLSALQQLIAYPEAVGGAPPYSLLSAAKEEVIPVLEQGGKVLILGQYLHSLRLLAVDPELQRYGCALIDGHVPSEARAELFHRLEDDPELGCIVGQIQAAGTGHNARSLQKIVFLPDPSKPVSEKVQGIGRGQRMLTKGDERFAREKLDVTFLEPVLAEEIMPTVLEPLRRKKLERGTVYEEWLSRDLLRLSEYKEFIARNIGSTESSGKNTLAEALNALAASRQQLADERTHYQLLTKEHLQEIFFRYRAPSKTAWRIDGLRAYIEEHFSILDKAPSELIVATLAGPELLEAPIYEDLGVLPGNIYVFEADPDPAVRRYARNEARKRGYQFFESKIEHIAPHLPVEFDIFSIDTDGYITVGLAEMTLDFPMAKWGIFLKNGLQQREHGESKSILELVGGDRAVLDREILGLLSARRTGLTRCNDIFEALSFSQRLRKVVSDTALHLVHHVGGATKDWEECLDVIARPWSRAFNLQQSTYRSPKGRPFLSSFACVEQQPSVTNDPAVEQLGHLLRRAAETPGTQDITIRIARRAKSPALSVEISDEAIEHIAVASLQSLVQSASTAVD